MGRKTRTYTTKALMSKKFKPFPDVTEDLKKMLGDHVEPCATIYIYGNSGHGKSRYVNALYQEISKCVTKIYHNNFESGISKVLQISLTDIELHCPAVWADKHTFKEMIDQVKVNRSKVVGLDSVDEMEMTFSQFKELEGICKKRGKMAILIGRANGKQHATQNGSDICFKCDIKIFVNEGVAYVNSRYGSVRPFVMQGVANHFAEQNALMKRIKKGELFSEAATARENKLKE